MTYRLLIEHGTVVTLDDAFGESRRADVLIEDGTLAAIESVIACDDCERIDATGMLVLPGLVESHRHLWYTPWRGRSMDQSYRELRADMWPGLALRYSPDDVFTATRAGVAECLDAGITSVLDWCHIVNTPEHASAAVDALRSMPINPVFAYGVSMQRKLGELAEGPWPPARWDDARRLASAIDDVGSTGGVSFALALQGPEATSWENTVSDIGAARDMGLPITMHVGIPQGPPPMQGVARLHHAGLLGPDMNFVHCNAITDEEIGQIAAAGATVTVTPMAELVLGLGIPSPGRFKSIGMPVALGADAVSAASGDLFDEARIGLLADRCRAAQAMHANGLPVDIWAAESGVLTTADALAAITTEGARACWQSAVTGSLTRGKRADLILVRAEDQGLFAVGDPVAAIVAGAHAGNVDTVIVAGRTVKRGGQLQGLDLESIRSELVTTRDRLLAVAARHIE
ncbi:MAG TPA: amidohydrolase family protein [Solirubrobacteraceae bacterium]